MSEEDSVDINNMSHTYEGDSFFELEKNTGSLEQIWIDKNCSDKMNYLTSDDYTDEDYSDMYTIKILNSQNKFNLGTCSTKKELITSLKTDMTFNYAPSNIMSIYTSPADGNPSGYGAKPTTRIIVKITVGNFFVPLGSVKRVLKENNKIWYALPMFNGKKRRVGNIAGVIGSSMNHGQTPGFTIYKLYTKEEIVNRVKVVENIHTDYPIEYAIPPSMLFSELYTHDNINPKQFILQFTKNIINSLEKLNSDNRSSLPQPPQEPVVIDLTSDDEIQQPTDMVTVEEVTSDSEDTIPLAQLLRNRGLPRRNAPGGFINFSALGLQQPSVNRAATPIDFSRISYNIPDNQTTTSVRRSRSSRARS
jgi:hypothetical protein